ncbi:YsaB family lipoprotein [Pseudescherichia sp.]|uniref:YsaB family lipoprotein n=1 Tax=Pseudescherichia sp. TaxID=2055881 RepID=UPI0028A0B9BD|nr:YsaB family lipoprotein [Pseudescherichia sp.]
MMTKCCITALIFLLVGCGTTQQAAVQPAHKPKVSPATTLSMEQLCRETAAQRYNTREQSIAVTGMVQFQASYEMRGLTPREERFVCAFDPDGQFLHLSMR